MVQKVDTPLPQTTQMPHWFWQVYNRVNSDVIDGTFAMSILPSVDNTYNLGSATKRWASVYGVIFRDGTNGTYLSSSGTQSRFGAGSDWVTSAWYSNGSARVSLASTGAVTIAAPSSGTALTVNGLSGAVAAISVTDGTVTSVWQAANSSIAHWGTSSNHEVRLMTNATSRLLISTSGNVTINTPSSGIALSTAGSITCTQSDGAFSGFIGASSITDSFTTDTSRVIQHYSISWKAFSDTAGTPAMAISGYAGIRFYTAGGQSFRIENTYVKQATTTVGSLVAAGTAGAGARSFVTDANATTFASVVAGGGANGVPVYSDGTNWRIG